MRNEKRFHRGWLMPFACMIMIASTSLLSAGMSTNLNAIKNVFGLSGTATSTIMTVRSISAFLVMFVADRYFEKFGLRFGTALAMVIGSLAFLIFAFGNGNIGAYYAAGAVGGITYAYGLMLPASMLIKRWFNKHRALALSICSAGTGLCSIIGAPVIQLLLDRYGIKTAFLLQGAFLLFVSVLLLLVIVNTPGEKGLEPVGGEAYLPENGKKVPKRTEALPRTWFVLLFIAVTLIGLNSSPCSSHLTLNFTTDGFPAMTVAKALSVYGFVLIASKLVYGEILDRLGAVKTIWIFGGLMIAGKILCFLATYAGAMVPFLYFSVIIYGLGVPVETLGYPNWCVDLTSAEDYPKVLSKLQMAYQFGALLGSSLPGVSCDLTGTYGWFYFVCAVLMTVSLAIVLLAYRKLVRKP